MQLTSLLCATAFKNTLAFIPFMSSYIYDDITNMQPCLSIYCNICSTIFFPANRHRKGTTNDSIRLFSYYNTRFSTNVS